MTNPAMARPTLTRKLLLLGALPAIVMFIVLIAFLPRLDCRMPASSCPTAVRCLRTAWRRFWSTLWFPAIVRPLSKFC